MNYPIQNYCEVPNLAPTKKKKGMKRQKLQQGYHRTYPYMLQDKLMKATTFGQLLRAYRDFASSHGAHSDMPQEVWDKIIKAEKSKEPV